MHDNLLDYYIYKLPGAWPATGAEVVALSMRDANWTGNYRQTLAQPLELGVFLNVDLQYSSIFNIRV